MNTLNKEHDEIEESVAAVAVRLNKALDSIDEIPKKYGRISATARFFGESHNTVRFWISTSPKVKTGLPDVRKIMKIADMLNVNIGWLLSGAGEMRAGKEGSEPVQADISLLGNMWVLLQNDLGYIDSKELSESCRNEVIGLIHDHLAIIAGMPNANQTAILKRTIDNSIKRQLHNNRN